jgi:hypothetical protein
MADFMQRNVKLLNKLENVMERVIKRNRRDSQRVRFSPIANDALRGQPLA